MVGSVAEWVKASFQRRPGSYDEGSTPTLVKLLRSWLGGFEQAANWVGKSSKKSTGTLDYWKLLSRGGFLQARSSQSNENCADRPTVSA